jgi:hypothetical protein
MTHKIVTKMLSKIQLNASKLPGDYGLFIYTFKWSAPEKRLPDVHVLVG